MDTTNSNTFGQKTEHKTYFALSFFITLILTFGILVINLFCTDFIFKAQSSPEHLFIRNSDASFGSVLWQYLTCSDAASRSFNLMYVRSTTIAFVTLDCVSLVVAFPLVWYGIRCLISYLTFSKWFKTYLNNESEIINLTDSSQFNYKVAMCVMTCNDLVPPTILQTMRQTYKNIDVWICDDSKKPEHVKMIDDFASANGIRVYRRPDEHRQAYKSKVGNLFGFLAAHGSEYDYIFENDSSTLTSPNFVENALRYFHCQQLQGQKIAAVIGLGAFFSTGNLISYINAKMAQYNETHIIGSTFRSNGTPLFLHGWGCLYDTKALMSMADDLKLVSCPTDDVARGCWLNKHGYICCMNPFDFTGKIGVRTAAGYNAQHLKWNTGDVHMARHHIINRHLHGYKNKMFGFFHSYTTYVFSPLLIFNIAAAFLKWSINFFYWNFSLLLLVGIAGIIALLAIFVLLVVFKADFMTLIMFALCGILEVTMTFTRLYTFIWTGWIKHKWSAAAVTLKEIKPSTTAQKWKECKNSLIGIGIVTLIFIALTFSMKYFLPYFNHFTYIILWLNLYVMFVLPPLLYIICVWLAEAPLNKGWDGKSDHFDFYKDDFRYRFVKETEVWKKQNPNDIK